MVTLPFTRENSQHANLIIQKNYIKAADLMTKDALSS